ncbi:MAG: DUF1553 domain-containing protein [Rudanella sp.]|nr:DUF1553 domain-containing protein [Rudanella sp.]
MYKPRSTSLMPNYPHKRTSSVQRLGRWLAFVSLWLVMGCGRVDKPAEIARLDSQLPTQIDYNRHVKPILSDKCFFCHGPDKAAQKAGLELATPEGAYAALKKAKGKHAIVPGSLSQSEVFYRLTTSDTSELMPPPSSNRFLTTYEKAVLMKWIEQGAEYKPHWALLKPQQFDLPVVANKSWPKNQIDYFVLSSLEKAQLKPAPEADRETLLRRVTLDLTGLPPTIGELDVFLADRSPSAYETVVNRLLKSPHYGEKMATDWLDVSRFADTHGYTVDRYRPMWPWRDWVINAFNQNMPFDRFTTWQLAGDLLPRPTQEQRLATAFNRNHSQNMEGGIINEEFRVEYVADRTNTVSTAFLGLTVECARCHDHKFDPISQKDYYSLFSFFNNIDEAGQISWDNAMPVPTLLLTETKHDSLLTFLDRQIKATETALHQTVNKEKPAFAAWQATNTALPPFDYKQALQAHFSFDKLVNGQFPNSVSAKDKGVVIDPKLVAGKVGQAFQSNGDDVLTLGKVGIFDRAQPFSVGLWVHIPKLLDKGVIFHKGMGDILYNFRGYFLNLRDGRAELLMAHTWPYNTLIRVSRQPLPKERWVHLMMTYNGSSKANGLKLYVDGRLAQVVTEADNLYKDILLSQDNPIGGVQPGLQLGADMRGSGFKNGYMDELVVYARELTAPDVAQLVRTMGATTPLPTFTTNDLMPYFLANVSKTYPRQAATLQELRVKRNQIVETIPELMVMDERKTRRPTYILKRGVYDAHGPIVQPDAPASVLPFRNFPKNRLGLAQWLLHPDNPLTARVIVNRYWQTYFGTGIHKTANNFGNQGGMPTHPELLDWLAVTFRESTGSGHNWNVKALQKLIVMSATYRQSSQATPELLRNDPDNLLLARGPSVRLTAEMVRDHALASSSLLSRRMGGQSVKPYQPDGLWDLNQAVYETDTGANLYRRSLYTFWRRTNPPPSMNTFDAPSRSYCLVQRQKTSTPLQALILLNDPQFVEATRVIAQRAATRYATPRERLLYTYRILTARRPVARELAILTRLYESEREKFRQSPGKMSGWLNAGAYRSGPPTDLPALAAGTVVASTIMNSDAFITKR